MVNDTSARLLRSSKICTAVGLATAVLVVVYAATEFGPGGAVVSLTGCLAAFLLGMASTMWRHTKADNFPRMTALLDESHRQVDSLLKMNAELLERVKNLSPPDPFSGTRKRTSH